MGFDDLIYIHVENKKSMGAPAKPSLLTYRTSTLYSGVSWLLLIETKTFSNLTVQMQQRLLVKCWAGYWESRGGIQTPVSVPRMGKSSFTR